MVQLSNIFLFGACLFEAALAVPAIPFAEVALEKRAMSRVKTITTTGVNGHPRTITTTVVKTASAHSLKTETLTLTVTGANGHPHPFTTTVVVPDNRPQKSYTTLTETTFSTGINGHTITYTTIITKPIIPGKTHTTTHSQHSTKTMENNTKTGST